MVLKRTVKWTLFAVLVAGSFQTVCSINITDCAKLNANCVLVTECVSAIDLLKRKQRQPLREAFCGYDVRGPKVCCPIYKPILFLNDVETATSRLKTTTVAVKTESQLGLPDIDVCGLSRSSEDRIVGGSITAIDEFPWLVRVKEQKGDRSRFLCGGSLISKRYVLTAAHCCVNRNVTGVRLGEWDTETEEDCQDETCSDPPVDIKVKAVIVHPLYHPKIMANDIALLELDTDVNFTDYIRPICLPSTEYSIQQDYVNGTSYVTAGWGLTEFEELSIIKRKVTLDVIPVTTCVENLGGLVSKLDPSKIICAGGESGRDTCNGDSGGPLTRGIVQNGSYNWYLYGITSFGTKVCGTINKPSVYTRIVSYMHWIRSIVTLG